MQMCTPSSSGCATIKTTPCATGQICEGHATATCVDATWAEWPMPNGPVDQARGAPNPASYKDNGDQTITDLVTGLMWQAGTSPQRLTWTQALAYCPTLTLGGFSDWHLPGVMDLVSIVDFSVKNPAQNAIFGASPNGFWSSSPLPGSSPAQAFEVSFYDGSTFSSEQSSGNYARCVR